MKWRCSRREALLRSLSSCRGGTSMGSQDRPGREAKKKPKDKGAAKLQPLSDAPERGCSFAAPLSFGFFLASRPGRSCEPIEVPPRQDERLRSRASRRLHLHFISAHPACMRAKTGKARWEGTGGQFGPDPAHEV